jgi:hypothetical protein
MPGFAIKVIDVQRGAEMRWLMAVRIYEWEVHEVGKDRSPEFTSVPSFENLEGIRCPLKRVCHQSSPCRYT